MTETATVKKKWLTGRVFITAVAGILVTYFLLSAVIDTRFHEIEVNTRELIADQAALLAVIAETTARNGADTVTESIVRDCATNERASFDNLLGRLDDGLSGSQLVELERLFGRCGTFSSDRKAVMVARLTREVELYEQYVSQLEIILDRDLESDFPVELWKQLAEAERKQSQLFSELVTLQDQIITTLLAGKGVESAEMEQIFQEVAEVRETLYVANRQAAQVRANLVSL